MRSSSSETVKAEINWFLEISFPRPPNVIRKGFWDRQGSSKRRKYVLGYMEDYMLGDYGILARGIHRKAVTYTYV